MNTEWKYFNPVWLLLAGLLCLPSSAWAGDLYVELRGGEVIVKDESYDALSDSNLQSRGTLGVGWGSTG